MFKNKKIADLENQIKVCEVEKDFLMQQNKLLRSKVKVMEYLYETVYGVRVSYDIESGVVQNCNFDKIRNYKEYDNIIEWPSECNVVV